MLGRLLQGSELCRSAAAAMATACSPHLQKCWVSTTSSNSSPPQPQEQQELTPEEQQHLDTLRYLIGRPLEAAQNAALLTALSASYRDLYVVMDQFHKKDILGVPRPLTDEPPEPSSSQQEQQQSQLGGQLQEQRQQQQQLNHTQMFYPLRDLTKLPDKPEPPGGFWRHHLNPEHMNSPTRVRMQMLPNHLEVSYHNDAYIYLWPPMEMFYPQLFDPAYVIRHLKPHVKRRRTSKSKKKQTVRCSLGYRKNKPYLKQRVFGTPAVPAALRL